ncbi:MAG: Rieske 2Fe-2S domain-containing protein [Bacteroidota bacterium]
MLKADGPHLAQLKIEGKKLCLIRCRGAWFVLSDKCSHQGGPLSKGFLNEKEEVVCPWHRFAFDPQTGQSESGGYFVKTYPLIEEGGQLYVEIPKRKFLGLF